LYWPYSDISNAAFTMVKSRTLKMGFKRVWNLILNGGIIVSGTH